MRAARTPSWEIKPDYNDGCQRTVLAAQFTITERMNGHTSELRLALVGYIDKYGGCTKIYSWAS